MDIRYTEFLKKGTIFYAPTVKEQKPYKKPAVNPNDWILSEDKNWSYYINQTNTLAKQGWKIHVTTTIKDSQKCLDVVSEYLIESQISFKFVPNIEMLLEKNSKYGDRASAGKFITVYPKNTIEFVNTLKRLSQITNNFSSGPYILNDKQWYDSNIFFRYGAFREMYANVDGKRVLGIENSEGLMIPDIRAPYYVVPEFVQEPEEVISMTLTQNEKYNQLDTSHFDKYEVKSALHFSNAGGVYKVTHDGKQFVMKEGRKESGLDRLNKDGFKRLKNEVSVLKRLQTKEYVVNVHDYFEIWKNNYLIEDYLPGRNLSDFVAEEFPFSNFQNKNEYTLEALEIIKKLKAILSDLHKEGISLGDLQPNNVMVLNNHDVMLIDLETATSTNKVYYPGLQTPGFVLQNADSFEEADWFAMWRIARFLFLPIEPVGDLADDIEESQDISIEENFGEEVLDQLKDLKAFIKKFGCKKNSNSFLSAANIQFKNFNLLKIKEHVRQGLLDNIDVNSESFIPGDIRQFTDSMGAMSVAYGGFGSVMALKRTGELPLEARTWATHSARKILKLPYSSLPKGLFNGLAGISEVLFEIGEFDLALEIFKECAIDFNSDDLSVFSGASGVGLIALSLYEETGNVDLLNKALSIGKQTKQKFNHGLKLKSQDPFGIPNGLLGGWSGIGLFMLELSIATDNEEFKKIAIQMVRKELDNNVSVDDNLRLAQVSDYSLGKERLIPYLGEGSVGIALVLLEFSKFTKSFNNSKDQKMIEYLCNVDETYCSYTSGLTRGITGFIVLENAKKKLGFINDYSISTLRNYLLEDDKHHIICPGDYGYRCSMDLFTGNSGLLLTLNDLNNDGWGNWFPVVPGSLSNLFGMKLK
ncbi:class III lanthionine synthetase LanKC [Lactiplantibacillus plantarum]|uniref:class III lanthionine synthetase LanKC n=1 Tax=Lactiplantibacillus plantarum TaxID=1590 RepID=UPI003C14A252